MVCGGPAGGYGSGSYGTVKVWTPAVTETGSLPSGNSASEVEFGHLAVSSPSTRDQPEAAVPYGVSCTARAYVSPPPGRGRTSSRR
jgi:hypothetical protein